jgi:hypothetical protein
MDGERQRWMSWRVQRFANDRFADRCQKDRESVISVRCMGSRVGARRHIDSMRMNDAARSAFDARWMDVLGT